MDIKKLVEKADEFAALKGISIVTLGDIIFDRGSFFSRLKYEEGASCSYRNYRRALKVMGSNKEWEKAKTDQKDRRKMRYARRKSNATLGT